MKVLISTLEAKLRRMPPLTTTAIGLGCMLPLGVLGYYAPEAMSLSLAYMLVVFLVGWGAGRAPAVLVSGAAVFAILLEQWIVPGNFPHPSWVMFWNVATRFVSYGCVGWAAAELAHLTGSLRQLVAERTTELQTEAERHKETASRLSEAVERFEQVANNISEAFWLSNLAKTEIAYVSPGYESIWGRKCEEAYREPTSWLAAVHPEDQETVRRRSLGDQSNGGYDVEYRIIRPDGSLRWIRDRAFPVRNARGEVHRIAGLAEDITEWRANREALQTQAAILESMAEGVVVTDEQGRVIQMNPAAEQMLGYARNEVLGQPVTVFSALPETEATALLRDLIGALKATGTWRGIFKSRRKDGAITFCEAVISRLEVQGQVLLISVEQNVTERLHAEQTLRESEETLRAFMNALPMSALLLERAGTVLTGNPPAATRLGVSPEELKGRSFFSLLPDKVAARRRAPFDEVIRTGQPVQFEDEHEGRHFITFTNPVLDAAGKVNRVAVIALDITERRRAESALARQEALYRSLFELSPDGILLEDLAGNILDANQAFCQSSGYPRAELLGLNVRRLVPTEDQAKVADDLTTLRSNQRLDHEVWNLTRSGERRLIRLNETLITLPDDSQRILVVAGDVTEHRRREQTREVFLSLGARLGAARSPLEAARAIYASADQLWKWDSGSLTLCLPESDQAEAVLAWDVMDGQRCEVSAGSRVTPVTPRLRRVIAGGGELILRRPGEVSKSNSVPFGDVSRLSASILCVPIRTKSQTVGSLSVQSYTPDTFTPSDLQTLQALADYGAAALERLRAEEALEQREELTRTMLTTVMDGFFSLDFAADPRGVLTDVNDAYCRMTGYSREELLQMRIPDLDTREGPEETARHREQIASTGTARFETRHRRKDGEEILIEVSACRLAGSRARMFGFVRDITERKRAELTKDVLQSLGAQLGTARSPLEAARAVYASADRLWQWDAATLDLYSQESDRMESVLLCDLLEGQRREVPAVRPTGVPATRPREMMREGPKLILRAPAEMPPAEIVMFGDTSRLSASLMYAVLRRDGHPAGLLSIQSYTLNAYTPEDLQTLQALADYCSGTLERMQTEQALRQHEELNKTILTTAMDGLYALDFGADPTGAITEVNDSFCRMTGYRREELLRMRMADIEAAESPADIARHKARILQAGTERFETRHRRKDGREITVEISASGLAGKSEKVFGFVRDITEHKRAELMREVLLSLGKRLIEAQTPLAAARTIFATADQLWQWDASVLQLYAAEEDRMNSVLLFDLVDGERREISPRYPHYTPSPALRRVMQNGPELTLRARGETERSEFLAFGNAERLSASVMYVPLRREGKAIGVLSIQSYAFDAYRQEDLQTLQALADYCGGAMDRIHAEAGLREAHHQLERRVQERTMELLEANDALKAKDARLDLALGASNAGTWSWDVRDANSWWGNRNRVLYGFEPEEPATFDTWVARVHPEDREQVASRMRKLMEPGGGGACSEEFRILHPTRGERWIASLGHLERDEAGRALRLSGISLDITERKAMSQALLESEQQYRRLHESMTDAFVRTDMSGRIIESNPALRALVGYTQNELSRLTYQDLTPGKWHALEERIVAEQIVPRGHSDVYEKEYRRQDGTVFPVELRTFLLRDDGGQPLGMWAIVRDITERKRASEALREANEKLEQRVRERTTELEASNVALRQSEQRYRTLTESSPDAIFILDQNIQVEYVNPAAASLWGRPPESIIGQSQADLLPPEIAHHQLQLVATLFATGEAVRHDELIPFPGGNRWLETSLTPMPDEQSAVAGVMAVSRDITERKLAEEALLRAERLQQSILANIPDPVWLKDTQGRFLAVNQALAKLYERPAEALLGRTLFELIGPAAAPMTQGDEQVIQTRCPLAMELSLADQQGQLRWFETIKSPLRNEPETVTGTVGIARDITDRKHAEYLLRAQRDLGAGLSTTSDVTTALKHLLEIALQIGGVDCGGIYLPDETNGGVELVEHRGVSAAFAQAVAHYAAGSPQMSLLQQGQSFFGSVGDLPSPVEASRLREGLRAIALVPLRHEGKLLGALTLASHTAAGIPAPARIIIEALAAQAAGALTRIRAETERHRLERQLLEITDREQARIGQDIHDGLCQHLVILAFDANSLHGELSAAGRPEVRKAAKIAAFLDEAITEARQLSRGLFPVRLEKEGLPPALEELARTTHRRFKVRCQFRCRGSIRLQDGTVATHLYRIAQEAVTNAVKHSHARSLFISLAAHAGQIELKVEDDGSGFSPKASPGQGGMGLHIMDYRARSIGGTVRLTPRPQGGTVVLCCVRGQFE